MKYRATIAVFREMYERQMIAKFDTHFYVATLHAYPDTAKQAQKPSPKPKA